MATMTKDVKDDDGGRVQDDDVNRDMAAAGWSFSARTEYREESLTLTLLLLRI